VDGIQLALEASTTTSLVRSCVRIANNAVDDLTLPAIPWIAARPSPILYYRDGANVLHRRNPAVSERASADRQAMSETASAQIEDSPHQQSS
jgi:hypothetical protein